VSAPSEVRDERRSRISACVVAMDEEDRIVACLDSLAFCDELVVVDSHSQDRTRELAAARGARVIERDWPGFGAQKEFAVRAAAHDWVLCLDADESVSPALRSEVLALRDAGFPGCAGWRMPRLSSWLGAEIRCGTWWPDRQLRLYDRRRGRWGGRPPHERVALDGPLGTLAGELRHEPYRDLAEHLATIERYTTTMAADLHARGRRARAWDLVTHPAVRFARFYVWKRGFRAGWRGLALAYLAAHYVRLKYTKLLVLQRAPDPATAAARSAAPPDRSAGRAPARSEAPE
jgi:glycosyltransferase involved in cell wall biosynthesis